MRETFAAVFILASAATAVGMLGSLQYGDGDIQEALEGLPELPMEASLEGTSSESLPGLMRGDRTRGLGQQGALNDAYRSYRTRLFSEEVDAVLGDVCVGEAPSDPTSCIQESRAQLFELRRERNGNRKIYDNVLIVARILWVLGILVSLVWLFHAYNEVRQSRRQPNRPTLEHVRGKRGRSNGQRIT